MLLIQIWESPNSTPLIPLCHEGIQKKATELDLSWSLLMVSSFRFMFTPFFLFGDDEQNKTL